MAEAAGLLAGILVVVVVATGAIRQSWILAKTFVSSRKEIPIEAKEAEEAD